MCKKKGKVIFCLTSDIVRLPYLPSPPRSTRQKWSWRPKKPRMLNKMETFLSQSSSQLPKHLIEWVFLLLLRLPLHEAWGCVYSFIFCTTFKSSGVTVAVFVAHTFLSVGFIHFGRFLAVCLLDTNWLFFFWPIIPWIPPPSFPSLQAPRPMAVVDSSSWWAPAEGQWRLTRACKVSKQFAQPFLGLAWEKGVCFANMSLKCTLWRNMRKL